MDLYIKIKALDKKSINTIVRMPSNTPPQSIASGCSSWRSHNLSIVSTDSRVLISNLDVSNMYRVSPTEMCNTLYNVKMYLQTPREIVSPHFAKSFVWAYLLGYPLFGQRYLLLLLYCCTACFGSYSDKKSLHSENW